MLLLRRTSCSLSLTRSRCLATTTRLHRPSPKSPVNMKHVDNQQPSKSELGFLDLPSSLPAQHKTICEPGDTTFNAKYMPVFDGFATATADCLIDLNEWSNYSQCPDILAYLALLGRGKHCLRACPTRDEVEAGRAYLASEYARGVGHFVDPTKVPGRTMALPYAGIRIPSPIAQAARPGVDNRVAPWAGLLHREELATMVSRFHEEALDTLPSYLQELAPDLFPRPVHPQPDKHEGYPFRAAMIATNIRAPLPYGVVYPSSAALRSNPAIWAAKYLRIVAEAYLLTAHPVSRAFQNPSWSYYVADGKVPLRLKFGAKELPEESWGYCTFDVLGYRIDKSPKPIVPGWTRKHGYEGVVGWQE